MSDTDIHSCSYHCDRHACVVAQRNELRDKLFGEQWVKTYSGGKPNYTQPIEKEWVGLTNDELLDIADMAYADDLELLQNIQAKLKEKNGG